ncbi:MAG: bacteriophage abortive infection AbiH family protein [Clostridia bacterium]|nr:bacteriophage abortive infection AbiH family protein [Clostridia bacterium]
MKLYFLGVIIINILVIGNGFDIAHGLPTSYRNFLDFVNLVNKTHDALNQNINPSTKDSYSKDLKKYIKENETLKNSLTDLLDKKSSDEISNDITLIYNLTHSNFWVNYFNKISNEIGQNWINFEDEISKIVQKLDSEIWSENILQYKNLLPKDFTIDKKTLIDLLDKDLYNLTEALEIYLYNYINEIYYFNDIDGKRVRIVENPDISMLHIDKVLSFNYTNTFERLYATTKKRIQFNYIHGKAQIHGKDTCNMILGINEYLPLESTNTNIDFIKFKKYFQRIHKNTGREHREWLDNIKEQQDTYTYKLKGYKKIKLAIWFFEKKKKPFKIKNPHKYYHQIYFFGHSLDIVDKDIIEFLILNDNVRTYIYYHNTTSYEEKIINLVKIIGKDELIKRTAGKNQTIFFLKQTDTIENDT